MSRDLKSGCFFIVVSLLVLYESLRLGPGSLTKPGSGFLIFCAGIVLFGLSVALVYRGWNIRESRMTHSQRVILTFAVLFAYSLVLGVLGFVVATFLGLTALFRLQLSRSWWTVLGTSALVTLLAYLVFGMLLHVYFPVGFLGI